MNASDLLSKKMIAGPALAAPLVVAGMLTGLQFTIIACVYLVMQGIVDLRTLPQK